jgi:hypothetical protein
MGQLNTSALSTFSQKPKNMFIITLIVMPLFVIENLEAYLASSIVEFSTSPAGLAVYTTIFVGYLVLLYFAINFIKQNSKLLKSKSRLIDGLQRVMILAQYALGINLGLILIQIFIFGQYTVVSLFFPTIVGLSLACVLFFAFGLQFLKWRRNIRQSLGILLFAFSFLLLGFVQFIDLPFLTLSMSQLPAIITPNSEILPPLNIESKLLTFLIDNSVYIDYSAFTLMIFGTALLL